MISVKLSGTIRKISDTKTDSAGNKFAHAVVLAKEDMGGTAAFLAFFRDKALEQLAQYQKDYPIELEGSLSLPTEFVDKDRREGDESIIVAVPKVLAKEVGSRLVAYGYKVEVAKVEYHKAIGNNESLSVNLH
jgi:hypothetical protein